MVATFDGETICVLSSLARSPEQARSPPEWLSVHLACSGVRERSDGSARRGGALLSGLPKKVAQESLVVPIFGDHQVGPGPHEPVALPRIDTPAGDLIA